MTKLLILAGTAEAREIAREVVGWPGLDAFLSLSGATRYPKRLALPTRIGGFGGAEGFADYLRAEKVDAVLDATHPFAEHITRRSWDVCRDLDVPFLHFLRPPWTPQSGDRWTEIAREEDASAIIEPPATVFLATGRQTLLRFAGLAGCRVICRQIDPPDGQFPFANGEFLVGRPPFSVEDEVALFQRLGVDGLIVKNAGGAPSASKLVAARALAMPVLMIARPVPTECPRVETIAAALDWIRELSCRNA